ncbi:MAG: hypothetical protein ACK4M6_03625 [Hyphomonas sp.]
MTVTLSGKEYGDHLLKLYDGQITHARHHELMRAQATNYIVVVSTALIGVLSSKFALGGGLEPYGKASILVALIAINIYGAVLSRKHYERSRRHNRVASAYRRELFRLHKESSGADLESLRQAMIEENDLEFKASRKIPLHNLWVALHLLFAGIGVFVFFMAGSPTE